MVKQYFLSAYRQIINHKFYFSLIAGALIVGFTSFILLAGYFVFERSFDQFHKNLPHVYRINFELYKEGKLNVVNATSCAPVGPVLYNQLGKVSAFTRLYGRNDGVNVKNQEENRWFPENAMYHADSGIFKIFDINLVEGQTGSVLRKPFTAIISKSTAEKLFGTASVVGEHLLLSEDEDYVIEGVFDDLPQNSHLELGILLSFSTLEMLAWSKDGVRDDWSWYSFYNYVLLEGDDSIEELNRQIASITKVYTKPIDERINGQLRYTLFPMSKIYLHSDLQGEMDRKGSKVTVQAVTLVAVLMLLMSLVNYLSLMSSWTMERMQETAIRTILGNTHKSIFFQFFTEISLHLLVMGTFSLILAFYLWSPFSYLIGYDIPQEALFNTTYIGLYYALIMISSMMFSFYYAAATKTSLPGRLLKGDFKTSGKGIMLRKVIVTFQFFCAISMIIGTLAMNNQIQFVQERPTGFDAENMLFVKIRRTRGDEQFYQNLRSVQQKLEKFSWVSAITTSSLVPGQPVGWTSGGKLLDQETTVKLHNYGVDEFFIPTLRISLAAGENFPSNAQIARRSVLINEEAMRALGYNNPADVLHKTYLHGGEVANAFEIIGVVKDFHQRGLQYKVEPVVFHYLPDNAIYSGPAYLTLKLTDASGYAVRLNEVEKVLKEIYPGRTLESDVLKNSYYRQYSTEKNMLHTLGAFSILAIVISSLGLIGLISFAALQRAKEIGIRKVLGASVVQIHMLIGKEFIYMIMLATAISIPLCRHLLGLWLDSFEYKTDLTPWPFLAGSILTIIFSVGVISGYIWRYATINPVHSLKSDR